MLEQIFEISVFIFLGLVFGSTASALIYRVPRELPWGFLKARRSQCPHCSAVLKPASLIPIFSYIFQKGRCTACKAPIAPTYLYAELTSLTAAILIYSSHGFTVEAFLLTLVIPALTALLFIDLKHMILPNALILNAALAGLIFHSYGLFSQQLSLEQLTLYYGGAALLYALLIFLLSIIMTRLMKKEALGMGDVKFFAMAGLWLGLAKLPLFLILSGVLGILTGIIWKIKYQEKNFPFGPALILSLFMLIIFPNIPYFSNLYFLFREFG